MREEVSSLHALLLRRRIGQQQSLQVHDNTAQLALLEAMETARLRQQQQTSEVSKLLLEAAAEAREAALDGAKKSEDNEEEEEEEEVENVIECENDLQC